MISATTLRDRLRLAQEQLSGDGGQLNEGAARVLGKLETVTHAAGLRRAYVKTGRRIMLWDLLGIEELTRRGYAMTRRHARSMASVDLVKHDLVTCWMREVEPMSELWIGEPLKA